MNNIHEKDWAEDSWSGHTGMDSTSDYSTVTDKPEGAEKEKPEAVAQQHSATKHDETSFTTRCMKERNRSKS